MATVHRIAHLINGDPMSPERTEARVRNLGEACAAEHGGRPADFALGAYRVEYERLYALYVAAVERCTQSTDRIMALSTDFWPKEGGRS